MAWLRANPARTLPAAETTVECDEDASVFPSSSRLCEPRGPLNSKFDLKRGTNKSECGFTHALSLTTSKGCPEGAWKGTDSCSP
eukprot:scaffold1970_cov396-Prasinococcus_capsulatus_cf.AAC.34